MYKHVAEAFVPVSHATRVAEKVCARYGAYCRSIRAMDTDTLLEFGEARAILGPTAEGLHFRVEARDIIIFHGVRTLLLGGLSRITAVPSEAIEWHSAGGPVGARFYGILDAVRPATR